MGEAKRKSKLEAAPLFSTTGGSVKSCTIGHDRYILHCECGEMTEIRESLPDGTQLFCKCGGKLVGK